MKRHILFSTVLLAAVSVTSAAHAQFTINLPGFGLSLPAPPGVGINIGLPVVPAAPYPYQPVATTSTYPYDYESLELDAPPDFVQPPELGFYVAVGVPFDLFFYNNLYYLYRNNCWYSSYYYQGPWAGIHHRHVPYALNRYPFDRIHHYRDTYYGRYQRYGNWEGQRHFRPERPAVGRGGYDRARGGNYARPGSGDRVYGDRPSYERTAVPRYDYGNRSSYNRVNNSPNRYYGSRPDAARSYSPNQGYVNRTAVARPGNGSQAYANRPSFNRPYSQAQRYGDRTAYSRPMNRNQSYGNRPSFNRANSSSQVSASRPAYSSPNNAGRNSGSRATFSRPANGGQGFATRAAYNRPYSQGQSSPATTVSHGNGRSGNGNFRGHGPGR